MRKDFPQVNDVVYLKSDAHHLTGELLGEVDFVKGTDIHADVMVHWFDGTVKFHKLHELVSITRKLEAFSDHIVRMDNLILQFEQGRKR